MGTSDTGLILATTGAIDGWLVREYLGIVSGEAVMRTASVTGRLARATGRGRSGAVMVEQQVCRTRSQAVAAMVQRGLELGATAIIAIDIDYTNARLPAGGELLIITASGTAVTLD
jgi:uncharacterized protein YbjQ (UPF0145 family)